VPEIAAGTIGTSAASPTRAAPLCGRAANFFLTPFTRRVPSGNMATILPSLQSSTAASIASTSCSPRRTGKAPPARSGGPSSGLKSSDFAMK